MASSKTMQEKLRYARTVVRSVQNDVNQQVRNVQDNVMNQIRQMVQNVTGNRIWVGKGADEFVREMTQEVLPDFERLIGHFNRTNNHIDRASEIITTADTEASGKVRSLVDIFRSIF